MGGCLYEHYQHMLWYHDLALSTIHTQLQLANSNSFVRKLGRPVNVPGDAGGAAQKSGASRVLRYTQYLKKRYIGIVGYINFARGCCGATQNADP